MVWREEDVRETTESAVLREILELNCKYEMNDYNGRFGEGVNYKIFSGRLPIMISAPHAVKQQRNGRMKERDAITGGIVEYLVGKFGLYGITRIWNAQDDPNFADDERSMAYRDKIAEVVKENGIKWVFDIHGCRNQHGFDIDVGINSGKNLVCDGDDIKGIAGIWQKEGLDVRIDEKFVAARLNTVSNYVHRETRVNCIQLELAEGIRKGDEKMEKFLRGFERILGLLSSGGGGRTNGRSGHPKG